ncbi:MAG: 50S ribosomal protein L17 [Planctomycetota bacterium]
MRHRVAGRKLSRTSSHRLAMRRNLVSSLFEHETVSTTITKAKEVRPFAEKMITLAKKGTLAARRQAISMLGNRDIVGDKDGKEVKSGTIIGKLFSELGPRYLDRKGGYTRIIKLPQRRLGDNGQVVLLQLVGQSTGVEEGSGKSGKKGSGRKKSKKTTKVAKEAAEVEVVDEQDTVEVKDTEAGSVADSTEEQGGKE